MLLCKCVGMYGWAIHEFMVSILHIIHKYDIMYIYFYFHLILTAWQIV